MNYYKTFRKIVENIFNVSLRRIKYTLANHDKYSQPNDEKKKNRTSPQD